MAEYHIDVVVAQSFETISCALNNVLAGKTPGVDSFGSLSHEYLSAENELMSRNVERFESDSDLSFGLAVT